MMSTMQLRSPCGHCGKIVSYAADMAGKKVLCPKCKRDFRLPLLEMPEKLPPPITTPPLISIPPIPTKRKKSSRWPSIAVGSLSLLAIIVAIVFFKSGTLPFTERASILKCSASKSYTVSGFSDRITYTLNFVATVKNNTLKPIDSLNFYVRQKEANRTVPVGETIEVVKIKGGIEPFEAREIRFSVMIFSINPNLEHINDAAETEPISIGIIDELESPYPPFYDKHDVAMTLVSPLDLKLK